jgi:hypothetical protein
MTTLTLVSGAANLKSGPLSGEADMERELDIPAAAADLAWGGLAVSEDSNDCTYAAQASAVSFSSGAGDNNSNSNSWMTAGYQGTTVAIHSLDGRDITGASLSELLEIRKA